MTINREDEAEHLESMAGLVETEDGEVALIVERLGAFSMPLEAWSEMWRKLGYQLRKRGHLERVRNGRS